MIDQDTAGASHYDDPVECDECGWKGKQRDCIHGSPEANSAYVPFECPKCRSTRIIQLIKGEHHEQNV
jgi:predicted RNA-binding Zn-ribbon protein involved in translation (DUF1610 family)